MGSEMCIRDSRKSYSIKKYADKFKKELNVEEIARKNSKSVTKLAKRVKQHAKSQALDNIKQVGKQSHARTVSVENQGSSCGL